MSEVLPPDSAVLAEAAATLRCGYLHVPFCRRRCPYCDFAVVVPGDPGAGAPPSRYVAAVVAEVVMEEPWGPLDAVAFGGGTPSTLAADDLARLLRAVAGHHGVQPDAEVSIEVNPEDWDERLAAALADAGFTRVSFGVQSFDPAVLTDLGRVHGPDEAAAAVRSAVRVGFSVNVDLIFGSPVETDASWWGTVTRALDLGIHHLSAYALTVERGTALSRAVLAGAPAPDPDVQAARWEVLAAAAADAGLVRYEVSNWARPGHHCRYNLATWAQGEYLGFGLGAHDHRRGVRARNLRRLDAYLSAVEAGRRPRAGEERLPGEDRERERLLLGLRRAAGVVAGATGERLLASEAGRRLVAAGVIADLGGRLVVRRPLLTDEVARAVLSL